MASPETLATPTTPTKPFASRSSPRTVCPHKAGILEGSLIRDFILSEIKLFVAVKAYEVD